MGQASSSIPSPDNWVEVHLLVETAISNCKIQYIKKSLADQVVCCDTLQLQYICLQVEKVKSTLTVVELHVGCVHMIVRHSGYSPDARDFPSPISFTCSM